MSIQSEIDRLTTIKANLKAAINGASGATVGDVFGDYPGAITSGKAAIASAITEKGVATAADSTFQQMAKNVAKIESGGSDEWNNVSLTSLPTSPPSGIQTFAPPLAKTYYFSIEISDDSKVLESIIQYAGNNHISLISVDGAITYSPAIEFYSYENNVLTIAVLGESSNYSLFYRVTSKPYFLS